MQPKPPVILIHGMWSTPDVLKDVRDAFEKEEYTVHAPRLPYHHPRNEIKGTLEEQLATASIEDYVASLSAFIITLKTKPIIVGHSMGGLLAQLIAAKHPCEKLILLSSAPPAGINACRWSVLRTFGHNLFKFPPWKKTTNLLLKNIQYGIANSQSAKTHQDIIRTATFESGKASIQISMWFLFRKPPTRVDYHKISCPVLLIGGTEDKITPIQIQRKITQNYSGRASLEVITGACHWTIGGSFFPVIKETMFTWINQHQTMQTQ